MKRFLAHLSLMTFGVILGYLGSTIFTQTIQAQKTPEYLVLQVRSNGTGGQSYDSLVQAALNEKAKEGWALDAVLENQRLIFKK